MQHRRAAELARLFTHLCFMVPDAHAAVVETGQHPRLGGMEIHAFDAVRPSCELTLDVQPERLREIKTENVKLQYDCCEIFIN